MGRNLWPQKQAVRLEILLKNSNVVIMQKNNSAHIKEVRTSQFIRGKGKKGDRKVYYSTTGIFSFK